MKSQREIKKQFQKMLEHFAQVLPAQATLRDFVHHNTLHGFEHLKFQDALKAAKNVTGAYGYWSPQKFREQYQKGRITDADIDKVLAADDSLKANEVLLTLGEETIDRKACFRIALTYPLKPISSFQLKWKVEEEQALTTFQADVPDNAKKKLLASAKNKTNDTRHHKKLEAQIVNDLWVACVDVLGLDNRLLHPEQIKELTPKKAEEMMKSLQLDGVIADKKLTEEKQQTLDKQQQAWDELFSLTQDASQTRSAKFSLRDLINTVTGVKVDSDVAMHTQSKLDPLIRNQSWQQQNQLFAQVGDKITLRGLLTKLTNIDIQEQIAPSLQRYIGAWLDEGYAAWSTDDKSFYHFWKRSALEDKGWVFEDMPEWQEYIDSLPDNSFDAVVAELLRMDIPEEKWSGYLQCLALELPGWSGMFYWRASHPAYETLKDNGANQQADMMDYLAVRLVMEHLFVRHLSSNLWLNEGNLSSIRGYFHRHYAEFSVRNNLYNSHLPEYLIGLSQQLVKQHDSKVQTKNEWHVMAHMIWTWQQAVAQQSRSQQHVSEQHGSKHYSSQQQTQISNEKTAPPKRDAWVLFRLSQHLGLSATDIRQLNQTQIDGLFESISTLTHPDKSGFLMLQAYEHHYREQVFEVIAKNHGRGSWANRKTKRPEAQVIFCMDDREEGFRRHLEHINPAIETLGAAAFFGVVMQWKALDAKKSVVLCPVVLEPKHEVAEVVAPEQQAQLEKHRKRFALRTRLREFIHQETQRNFLRSSVMIAVFSPFALMTLMGKVFMPYRWGQTIGSLKNQFDSNVITRVNSSCETDHLSSSSIAEKSTEEVAEKALLQHGFTIEEQTNIVASFLQNNGLLSGFSNFVVTMGHYSHNQNNPHAAAYGCGACGGKFSGPNGRVFAAMANHPEVRAALKKQSINIPDDCWFVGAEHDTCNEAISWDDTDLIPDFLMNKFEKLKQQLALAAKHSAHERCRKLASAPKNPNLKTAEKHIAERAVDFSQARPELGHATIAAGFVGRRHLSQGTFMDRRCFLISYDASVDPEGEFLERILLSAGPVGAGINLEYYFSAVNNEKYGSGSKVVHNLAGLFAVMEGASGDLRTGLPVQMIEIHEPMRLQLMVEAQIEVLTKIYKRQASIQQLVGNGWLLLSSKDPDTGIIHTFDPDKGWSLWSMPEGKARGGSTDESVVKQSSDWYRGQYDHLPPTLLEMNVKVNE